MDHSLLDFILFIVCFSVIFNNHLRHKPILQSKLGVRKYVIYCRYRVNAKLKGQWQQKL